MIGGTAIGIEAVVIGSGSPATILGFATGLVAGAAVVVTVAAVGYIGYRLWNWWFSDGDTKK